MTDPTHEQPPTLVERLRNTAINLTTTYVAVDANGDPIGQPRDGSEEADFEQFDDPVEFEPEELHDLANLYREAATALVAHESEILSRDERIAILESQIAATRKQAFFGALHDGEVARDLTVYTSGLDALHVVLTGLLNAEPALDREVFPVDPATGERKLEGEGGLEMATRLLLLAAERGAFGGRTGARPGQGLEAVDARFTEVHFLAEPCRVGLRFEGVPFDIRVPDADAKVLLRSLHENFINDKPDEAARKAEFFRKLNESEVARQHHADLRHAMGHTARKPSE